MSTTSLHDGQLGVAQVLIDPDIENDDDAATAKPCYQEIVHGLYEHAIFYLTAPSSTP